MTYKELQNYLIEKRKKSVKQYNKIVATFLSDAPNGIARRKIWLIHLTSDPIGKMIFKDSYNEVQKFINEEVEF